jgi:hypothetical protein
MLTLVEQARFELEAQRDLLAWLAEASGPFPASARAADDAQRSQVDRLRAQLVASGCTFRGLDADPSLSAAVICVLFAVGLRREEQLQAALCIARAACMFAESSAAASGTLRQYPVPIPPFDYREGP